MRVKKGPIYTQTRQINYYFLPKGESTTINNEEFNIVGKISQQHCHTSHVDIICEHYIFNKSTCKKQSKAFYLDKKLLLILKK
jgi:hypothetical protein